MPRRRFASWAFSHCRVSNSSVCLISLHQLMPLMSRHSRWPWNEACALHPPKHWSSQACWASVCIGLCVCCHCYSWFAPEVIAPCWWSFLLVLAEKKQIRWYKMHAAEGTRLVARPPKWQLVWRQCKPCIRCRSRPHEKRKRGTIEIRILVADGSELHGCSERTYLTLKHQIVSTVHTILPMGNSQQWNLHFAGTERTEKRVQGLDYILLFTV